jgi:glycine/D-amino acid oxidase-like deaminating enzyme
MPLRADVVVVGGGITGVSLAYWLGRGGADVLVLERARLAAGASGRNAGFLLAGVASSYANAVAKYGHSLAAEVWAFTLENNERFADLLAGRAGWRRGGSWTLAASADEALALQTSAQLLREDGLPGEWVPAAGVRGPGLGGLLNPSDGELQPVEAVAFLADVATALITEDVEVIGIEPGGSGVRIHTSGGEVGAGAVVLATNGYTRQILPSIAIDPVRGQMLATGAAGPVTDRPVYTEHGFVYWRQLVDRRVVVGGFRHTALADEIGYDERPTEAVQRHLDAYLPSLGLTAAVTHRWAGVMGFTRDGLPLVGAVPGAPGVHVCAGYSGHGMGFAFNCARLLADSILGGAPPPGWLSPSRAAAG